MPYEQKPNTGALFKNLKKEKDTHPDYQGNCLVNGRPMRISAWINTSKKDGSKFMALNFQEPLPPKGQAPAAPQPELPEGQDVPF